MSGGGRGRDGGPDGGLPGHRRLVDDVEREVESHLRMRVDEMVARGWDPRAAREEAERMFGDAERVRRECEEITRAAGRARRWRRARDGILQDLRYAGRTLARSPVFAAVALLTLGLGIGANSAIFSAVRGILLDPLPYPDPDRIVWLRERTQTGGTMAVAWPNARDWREEARSFRGIAPYNVRPATVLGLERPVRAVTAPVGRDFWTVFPVRPVAGRLTGEEDHREGAEPVAVVAADFWRDEMGGVDLGEAALEVQGIRLRVVGVIPAAFDFPGEARIWVPAELSVSSDSRTAHNWSVVARLADGVGVEAAGRELDPLTRRLVADEPADYAEFTAAGAVVVPLRDQLVGEARTPLLLLLGAATLVLLVACTNLTSTLLARGAARERELAIRASLGAGRARIARLLLAEAGVLAVLGAVVGLAVAAGLLQALQALGPTSLPRLAEVGLDAGVVAYTGVVALGTTLLVGLLPALRLSGGGPAGALGSSSRGNAPDHRSAIWRLLVGTEVALALVLVVASGLLVRSFQALVREDPGFHAADVATLAVSLPQAEYTDPGDHARAYATILREVTTRPGVTAAGLASSLPVQGSVPNGRLELDGDLSRHTTADYVTASGGYFEAMDIPLLQGRVFDDRDGPDAPHVAMVSRAFAERVWPGLDPVGRQVSGGGMDGFWEERPFATVVGVVGDVRYRELGRAPEPTVYFPFSQRPSRIQWGAYLVAETGGDPAALVSELRGAVVAVEPDVAPRAAPMAGRVAESLAGRRFLLLLLGSFAGVALLLSVVGIYGVVAWTVARRTREMGIRLALGAPPGRVRSEVVGRSMVMVGGGLAVGLAGALLAGGLVEGLLYGVEPFDPLAILAGVGLLGAAGWVASWIPARRGTRVDPGLTLRSE